MVQTSNTYGFSQFLFWDTNVQNFDIDKNASWLIQRVLEYGNMNDWKIVENHFGLDKIIAYSLNFRTLDPVALSFLCFISGAKKEDFRCYHTAQLTPTPWNS